VQTTTFSKTRKKTSQTPTKKKKYMQKLPREKHIEAKYSPGFIFFAVDD